MLLSSLSFRKKENIKLWIFLLDIFIYVFLFYFLYNSYTDSIKFSLVLLFIFNYAIGGFIIFINNIIFNIFHRRKVAFSKLSLIDRLTLKRKLRNK